MNPGRLNRKIEVERPKTAPDAGGGRSKKWERVGVVWGAFLQPKTTTVILQGGPASIITQKIKLRGNIEVEAGYRITERGKQFKVTDVCDADEKGYIFVVCEEVRHYA